MMKKRRAPGLDSGALIFYNASAMDMNRRTFLQGAGAGLAATVFPSVAFAEGMRSVLPGNRADCVFEIGRRGEPLIAADISKRIYIASLTKLQVAKIVFDEIQKGHIDPRKDKFRVTPRASRDVKAHESKYRGRLTYEQGLMLALTRSYNDIPYSIAQDISSFPRYASMHKEAGFARGTEWAFHRLFMNPHARALGMENTNFWNSHGLPGRLAHSSGLAHNTSTLADLGILCEHLVKEHGEFLNYFAQPELELDQIGRIYNTNRLLENATKPGAEETRTPGVIGLKTGFYNEAGWCLALYAERGDTRLIAMTTGHKTPSIRNEYAQGLVEKGFAAAALRREQELHRVLSEPVDSSCCVNSPRNVGGDAPLVQQYPEMKPL